MPGKDGDLLNDIITQLNKDNVTVEGASNAFKPALLKEPTVGLSVAGKNVSKCLCKSCPCMAHVIRISTTSTYARMYVRICRNIDLCTHVM
jgi:hypothetical protein